jgi:starch synthase (maltosyl-transferring)
MVTLLTKLNDVRSRHLALRRLRGLTVHWSNNPNVLCFTRHVPAAESPTGTADTVIVIASFDPHTVNDATITLDMSAIGLAEDAMVSVTDAITSDAYSWGRQFYVRLDPAHTLVHVAEVR